MSLRMVLELYSFNDFTESVKDFREKLRSNRDSTYIRGGHLSSNKK